MSFEAGAITGRLDLDTTSFHAGMEEAHTHAESEGGRIREIFESIAEALSEVAGPAVAQFASQLQSVFAGFSEGPVIGAINAIGVAMGAVREAAESTGERFDEMNLAAQRAGVGVEWLSQLAAVGRTVGVGIDQLGMAFRVLEQQAGTAIDGTDKKAASAFAKLHISMQDLGKLSDNPQELFERIQKGIAGIADQSERVATIRDVLGRGGFMLAPLLEMDPSEFADRADVAERLNATVTKANAKEGESFGRLKAEVAEAMDAIEEAASRPVLQFLVDHVHQIEPVIENAVKGISGDFASTWQAMSEASSEMGPTLKGIGEALEEAGHSAGPLLHALLSIQQAQLKDELAGLTELAPGLEQLIRSLGTLAGEVGGPLSSAFRAVEPLIAQAASGIKDLIADANVAIKTIAGLDTSKDKGGGVTSFMRNNMPHVIADYDALRNWSDNLHVTHAFSGEVSDLGYNPYDRNSPVPKQIGDDSAINIDHVNLRGFDVTQNMSGLTVAPVLVASTPQIAAPIGLAPSAGWTPLTPAAPPDAPAATPHAPAARPPAPSTQPSSPAAPASSRLLDDFAIMIDHLHLRGFDATQNMRALGPVLVRSTPHTPVATPDAPSTRPSSPAAAAAGERPAPAADWLSTLSTTATSALSAIGGFAGVGNELASITAIAQGLSAALSPAIERLRALISQMTSLAQVQAVPPSTVYGPPLPGRDRPSNQTAPAAVNIGSINTSFDPRDTANMIAARILPLLQAAKQRADRQIAGAAQMAVAGQTIGGA